VGSAGRARLDLAAAAEPGRGPLWPGAHLHCQYHWSVRAQLWPVGQALPDQAASEQELPQLPLAPPHWSQALSAGEAAGGSGVMDGWAGVGMGWVWGLGRGGRWEFVAAALGGRGRVEGAWQGGRRRQMATAALTWRAAGAPQAHP
jgi:hypothetical protein